jgi:GT2 family glycosyltransferase
MAPNKPKKPSVSVVVLGYNEKRYLENCLSAVLDQDYPHDHYEVLFVDNASNDGSSFWVGEHFPVVKVVRLEQNLGFGGGNNQGVAHAQGELVAFLNADTVVHRSWLSGMVHALDQDPQVKACVSGGLAPDLPGFDTSRREAMPDYVYYGDIVRFGHVGNNRIRSDAPPRAMLHLSGCSAILDLSILDELEYVFDESYFLDGDDTDLGFRINGLGYKLVVAPKALFYHLVKVVPADLKPSKQVLRRMVGMHRNRFVTYFRNMHTSEFLLALPILFIGSSLKPFTFEMSLGRKLAYAMAIVPVTLYAMTLAMLTCFPHQVGKRRRILCLRRRENYWFLKQILNRKHYTE